MKKFFLFTGLFLLIFMAACQSADADEVLEYHNGYVENVSDKMDDIDVANEKIYTAETDDEAMDIVENELEPLLDDMKNYMDKQDPEKDPTIEYHELRSKAYDAFYDSMKLDIETYKGIIDGSLTEEEADKNYDESEAMFMDAQKHQEKADEKIEELSDKYKFEDESQIEEK